MDITNKCLSEMQVAECAEAINQGRYEEIGYDVRAHLRQCDRCASEVLLVADLTAMPATAVEPSTRQLFPAWFRYSAAAAVVVLFFVAKMVMSPPQSTQSNQPLTAAHNHPAADSSVAAVDLPENTTAEEKPVEIITTVPRGMMAANEPNAALEKLVQRSLSANRSGREVKVVTPATVEALPEVTRLQWENPRQEMLTLVWINNLGKEVKTIQTNGNTSLVPRFKAGLYYWKLISSDDDLLWCGKVTIR